MDDMSNRNQTWLEVVLSATTLATHPGNSNHSLCWVHKGRPRSPAIVVLARVLHALLDHLTGREYKGGRHTGSRPGPTVGNRVEPLQWQQGTEDRLARRRKHRVPSYPASLRSLGHGQESTNNNQGTLHQTKAAQVAHP
jgi:hypothetical protein